MESDASEAVLEDDSGANLGVPLVDSDKAGHDPPITRPASDTTPFEGLFHAGFLDLPALPSPPSELSGGAVTTLLLSTSGEAATAFGEEESEEGSCSGTDATLAAREEEEEADDGGGGGGDWGVPAVDSGSAPRTT